MPSIYKITYQNGKIYVGSDLTDSINYFGSADTKLVEKDFSHDERRTFTVTREILWFRPNATNSEIRKIESQFIIMLSSNDPQKGYNRWPPFKPLE